MGCGSQINNEFLGEESDKSYKHLLRGHIR